VQETNDSAASKSNGKVEPAKPKSEALEDVMPGWMLNILTVVVGFLALMILPTLAIHGFRFLWETGPFGSGFLEDLIVNLGWLTIGDIAWLLCGVYPTWWVTSKVFGSLFPDGPRRLFDGIVDFAMWLFFVLLRGFIFSLFVLVLTLGWIPAFNYAYSSGLSRPASFARAPLGLVYLTLQIPVHVWETRAYPISMAIDKYFKRCGMKYNRRPVPGGIF
jgi:hypothetical protein